jgi:23S rRNA pseudouridine1911/1915/1917 synthase
MIKTFVEHADPIISSALLALADQDEGEDILPSGVDVRQTRAEPLMHGQRLDKALVLAAPEFSRNYLQQLIVAGGVCVNSAQIRKPATKIKFGDVLQLELRPTAQSQAYAPQAIDLQVVYEDAQVYVLDKPAGLVVHPAPGNWSGTLLNGLLAMDPGLAAVPRAGIVHRLDKDTSGLMVVARTRKSMDVLVQAIASREMRRQYLALAKGPWRGPPQQSVKLPIGRDPRNRLRMAVVNLATTPGKTAQTDINFLGQTANGCLVHCVLHTGRTHQIRVHMASLGHPLLGDSVYGGPFVTGLGRQALHAFRLAFAHPMTGAPLAFESHLPPDLAVLLDDWGLRYNAPPL